MTAALSQREREVVQGVWDGLTAKQIGERLCISEKTVEQHRFHVNRKWGVTNTVQMIRRALQEGVVTL
jgi:DNA-binding NarL/FixJ family response regulator